MGFTVYMFDFPFTGERTIVELSQDAPPSELFETTCSLLGKDFNEDFIHILVDRIYQYIFIIFRDVYFMRGIGAQYHGFTSDKIILIGISTGAIIAGHLFTRYKIADRLYCITGHISLPKFAQGFLNVLFPGLGTTQINHIEDWVLKEHSNWPHGAQPLLEICRQLMEPVFNNNI